MHTPGVMLRRGRIAAWGQLGWRHMQSTGRSHHELTCDIPAAAAVPLQFTLFDGSTLERLATVTGPHVTASYTCVSFSSERRRSGAGRGRGPTGRNSVI